MTVSVAMATYNGAAYIERQLQSVLSQLQEADELVVSDDGSTDGTRRLLDKWASRDARIKVIDGPKAGAIKNFEHAVAACVGDWIFLCDQDDEWDADKYGSVMIEAENGAMLVMHDARIVDEDGRVLKPSFFATRGTKTGLLKNLWKNSYIGCCMAFSRRLTDYVLPFPDSIPMHDQWIGLQAERHGNVVLIDRPLMSYRRHGGNVTADEHGSLGTMLKQRAGMIR
ncbi:MAG: glycosyltransferase family 2 protein, partial [Clostridia bacterium]|nr:glycosyltransferase family 2 protein [Clostridia bacterium]